MVAEGSGRFLSCSEGEKKCVGTMTGYVLLSTAMFGKSNITPLFPSVIKILNF